MNRRIAVILAFMALSAIVVAFVTQRPRPARSVATDTYGEGALGHQTLRDVMQDLGVHVLVDRRGVHGFADAPVFFVEPTVRALDRHDEPIELRNVLSLRAQQGLDSVLVLPKWRAEPGANDLVARAYKPHVERVLDAALPFGLADLRREDTDVPQTAMLRSWTVPGRAGPREVVLLERQTLRLHDRRAEVLLGSRRSALVVRYRPRSGSGSIYIVSDPDLLHNFNHHRGEHAQIMLDILAAADSDTMVIDEVFHGHAFADTRASALGSGSTVIVVAHLVGLGLLFAWAGARRFGPDAAHPSPQSASAQLLHVGGQALAPPTGSTNPGLVGAYITLVVTDLAEKLGVLGKTSLLVRAQSIDAIAERRGVEGGAANLLEDAKHLPRSRRALLVVAHRAHALRERLLQLKETR